VLGQRPLETDQWGTAIIMRSARAPHRPQVGVRWVAGKTARCLEAKGLLPKRKHSLGFPLERVKAQFGGCGGAKTYGESGAPLG
jgi:hypothetical protein